MVTKNFILAGRSVFTVECPSGWHGKPHYTFRVGRKKANGMYPECYFVSLLSGPQNTSDYTYLGKLIPSTGAVVLTEKSRFSDDTLVVKLIRRVVARVWANEAAEIEKAGFDVHHEGRCGCCGRPLTTPQSILSGIGPVCAEKGKF